MHKYATILLRAARSDTNEPALSKAAKMNNQLTKQILLEHGFPEHLCAAAIAAGGRSVTWCVEFCLQDGAAPDLVIQDVDQSTLVAMGFPLDVATAALVRSVARAATWHPRARAMVYARLCIVRWCVLS